jgi:hypothetical protein
LDREERPRELDDIDDLVPDHELYTEEGFKVSEWDVSSEDLKLFVGVAPAGRGAAGGVVSRVGRRTRRPSRQRRRRRSRHG